MNTEEIAEQRGQKQTPNFIPQRSNEGFRNEIKDLEQTIVIQGL